MKEILLILSGLNVALAVWQILKLREADRMLAEIGGMQDEIGEMQTATRYQTNRSGQLLGVAIDEQTVPYPSIFHPEKTFGKN